MEVLCPVSIGELVDKLSILKIKREKIIDPKKSIWVEKEHNRLEEILRGLKLKAIDSYLYRMVEINSKLWEIEDLIRDEEFKKDFGPKFISLARKVYQTNDLRFKVKNLINETYESSFQEVKSYQKYDTNGL